MPNVWNLIFGLVDQNTNERTKEEKKAQRFLKGVEVFGPFYNSGFFKRKK